MVQICFRVVCLAGLLLVGAPLSHAAEGDAAPPDRTCVWASGGVGVGSGGGAVGAALYYERRGTLIGVRTVAAGRVMGGSQFDVGVLYGYATRSPRGFTALAAGLAMVDYGDESTTIGIPLQFQAMWTPTSVVGLGVTLFGDINTEKSFGGWLLCLNIGKVR